jgi:hypothetical protein
METRIYKYCLRIFCLLAGLLAIITALQYPGNIFIYVIFTILLNGLLIYGFRENKLFFDTCIGLLFWLGFWFKSSFRIAFMNGIFRESVGEFNSTGRSL